MRNGRPRASGAAAAWREAACLAYVAIIYLAADGFYIVERLHWIGAGPGNPLSAGDYARRAVFVLGYALAIAAVYALALHRSRLETYRNRLSHLEIAESVRNALGYGLEIADSIFKDPRFLAHQLCGVHGPPKPMFGAGPRCTMLPSTDPGTL